MMHYYKGDMTTFLDKLYLFFKSVGYDVEMSEATSEITFGNNLMDKVVTCNEFSTNDLSGTGSWSYSIGEYWCDELKSLREAIRIDIPYNEGTDRDIFIYKLNNTDILNFKRLKFEGNQWLEMILSLMMPSFYHQKLLQKFKIVSEKDIDVSEFGGTENDIYSIIKYTRVAREIKLNMLLDD